MFVLAHTELNFSVGAVTLQPFIKSCVYGAPYLRPPCLTHHYRLACVAQTTHVNSLKMILILILMTLKV